jgi:hypothetical protein
MRNVTLAAALHFPPAPAVSQQLHKRFKLFQVMRYDTDDLIYV